MYVCVVKWTFPEKQKKEKESFVLDGASANRYLTTDGKLERQTAAVQSDRNNKTIKSHQAAVTEVLSVFLLFISPDVL